MGWQDAWVGCYLNLAVPIDFWPPSALDLPGLPILTSLCSLPLPWYGVPTEPANCPYFCRPQESKKFGHRWMARASPF